MDFFGNANSERKYKLRRTAMKYLSMYTPDPKLAGIPPSQEHMAAMGKLIEESMKAGILVATGGLQPLAKGGARVKRSGNEITAIDGPFSETKEVVGGFAILEAKSKEEVIDITKRFLKVAGDGECELHQIMDGPPPDSGTR
jgi:hypothetical protein